MIASSVAWIVAVNNAFIRSLAIVVTCFSSVLLNAFLFAVEKAIKISPDLTGFVKATRSYIKGEAVMIDLKQYEVWFVTWSQHLYGPKTLEQVAEHSRQLSPQHAGLVQRPRLRGGEEFFIRHRIPQQIRQPRCGLEIAEAER